MDFPSDKSTPCTLEGLTEANPEGLACLSPGRIPTSSQRALGRSTLLEDLVEPHSRSNGTPGNLPSSGRIHVLEPCSEVGSAPGAGGGIRTHEGLRHGLLDSDLENSRI